MKNEAFFPTENTAARHPFVLCERLSHISLTVSHNDFGVEYAIPWKTNIHSHSQCEIIVTLAGEEIVTVEDKPFLLRKKDICIIPPQISHRCDPIEGVPKRISLLLSIDARSEKRTRVEKCLLYIFNNLIINSKDPLVLRDSEELTRMIESLIPMSSSDNLLLRSCQDHLLFLFIRKLFYEVSEHMDIEHLIEDMGESSEPVEDTGSIRFQMIEQFLYQNCQNHLGIAEVAKMLYLCPRQTSRLINAHYGIGFKQLLNKYRMQKAKDLLEEGYSQANVAQMIGFQSLLGFQKAFCSTVGVLPNQYLAEKAKTKSNA